MYMYTVFTCLNILYLNNFWRYGLTEMVKIHVKLHFWQLLLVLPSFLRKWLEIRISGILMYPTIFSSSKKSKKIRYPAFLVTAIWMFLWREMANYIKL